MADDRDVAAFKAEMDRRKRVAATKQGGTQLSPVPPSAPSANAPEAPKKGVNFLNPRAVNADREQKAGLACGGKVRKMAAGGKVRGEGCAVRSKKCKML